MLTRAFKFLIEILWIVCFILLELSWFRNGASLRVRSFSFQIPEVKKLLGILIGLGLVWLFVANPWRKSSFWFNFKSSVSHVILILLFTLSVPIVFLVKEKNSLTHGLMGSYYSRESMQEEPLFKRIDPDINFPNHALDEFSRENYFITWTGYIRIPRTNEYTFTLRSDDGSALFIDDQLVIDNSGYHNARTKSGVLHLEEGFHPIKVSYFQYDKAHLLHLYWSGPRPFHWMKIIPGRYLYPEKPDLDAYQREQGTENVILALKILWLGVGLYYIRAFLKSRELREAYLTPFLFILIFVLALVVRLYLLEYPLGTLDSDEAIEGLMAKHILTQGERPILYYELPYMGSLKAHLAAAVFYFSGVSVIGLKLISVLFFLVFLWLMFLFTYKITDTKTALLTALLLAISPGFLALRSIYAGAAYMELLAFGTALLVILARIFYSKDAWTSHPLRWYGLAGFLAGVGFWTNPQIISYVLTFTFFWFLKDRLFVLRKSFAVFLLFALVGVFPLLLWNVQNQWETYTFLTDGEKSSWESQWLQFPTHFHDFLTQALPILVGTHTQYAMTNIAGDFAYLVIGVYVLSLGYALWRWDRSLSFSPVFRSPENRSDQITPSAGKNPQRLEIPLVLTLVTIGLFCGSNFGTLSRVPRYLLPLYSTLPIFLALFLLRIKRVSSVLFVFLLAVVLGVNLLGIFHLHKNSVGDERGLQTFLSILKDRHIRYIDTDYWIAYTLTFASNEEVICSPNLGPFTEDKYPAYTQQVLNARDRAYVAKIGLIKDKELEKTLLTKPSHLRYHNIKYFYSLYYPIIDQSSGLRDSKGREESP
jgi:hypothetical protein